ncbi:MAG TPA: sigma factor, partial [Kofleriaceae bacterium]|nr:sigma factor [Kofleriaceae bacterium]
MRDELEVRLGQLVRERALDEAATLALASYGAELFGFLINLMGGETEAGDVFSQAVEDFWRGLPRFDARSTVRTWLYVLTQHAAARYRRSPWNGARRTGDAHLDSMAE